MIPWNEPGFSRRMLREHLSQAHDAASRRLATIDRHVAWISRALLASGPAHVLDLGCGPGLYTERLARLGHVCTGIDFSPASIEYARERASSEGLACDYRLEDLRRAQLPPGQDLILMVHGELNAFAREDARALAARVRAALAPGGRLLLEVSPLAALREQGAAPPAWTTAQSGLFGDAPYLYLREACFSDGRLVRHHRIVHSPDGRLEHHREELLGYTDAELDTLLREAGFDAVEWPGTLAGERAAGTENVALVATFRAP